MCRATDGSDCVVMQPFVFLIGASAEVATIALMRASETVSSSLAARLEISPRASRSITGIHSGPGSAVRAVRCPSRPK